jgi:hypothetical protein
MSKKLPKATHEGVLNIGNIELPCAVLEDGTRLISERGVIKALGGKRGGSHWRRKKQNPDGANMPIYLSANNLTPFINEVFGAAPIEPMNYETLSGVTAHGLLADRLHEVCEVWLKAREADALHHSQHHIAKQAEILMRGFAHVGVIALVDEATGYQYVRARKALEEILDQFVSKELRKWSKTFPDEFYEHLFKLRGWKYVPFSIKRPAYVGKLTNDLIYERLAPGVLEELKHRNPPNEKGRRRHKHFQWLTEDVGHPRLREHIASVIALMKASTKWEQFYRMLQRALPRQNTNLELPLSDEEI